MVSAPRRYVDCVPKCGAAEVRPIFRNTAKLMEERVKKNLAKHLARVIDLFRRMDTNGDGLVSRTEFTKGLIGSGVCSASLRTAIASVFDSWDVDGSGALDFREFRKRTPRPNAPPPPPLRRA